MKDNNHCKLIMIGAMYENGGNMVHRFLDGHPQLHVYPFESQVGTKYVNDYLSSMYPLKYRWPVFDLAATPEQDFKAIIDEETKVRARTPLVSKFRHVEFDLDDDARSRRYQDIIADIGRSRPNNIEAFYRATFDAWKNLKRTGREQYYVGYSPIITVDADKILGDMPNAHFFHVVRNPWSAFGDTKKRPVPLSLQHYMLGWTENQYYALQYQKKFPDRFHIIQTENVLASPRKTLNAVLQKIGLEDSENLNAVTWNGEPLKEVYPWGTIRKATQQANLETALELTSEERKLIYQATEHYLDVYGYHDFIDV